MTMHRCYKSDGVRFVATLLVGIAMSRDAAARQCRADAADVMAVRDVANGIVAADNRGDVDRVLDFYSEDAVLLPPGEAAVVGRDAIRPRYESLFEAFTPEIEPEIEQSCVDGDLALVRGRNGGRLVSKTSGDSRALDDAYLMILRRRNGTWKISHLMWHRRSSSKQ